MPRKFVTLGIFSIVLIAFMDEAHRKLVVNLFWKVCQLGSMLFLDVDETSLLQKWEVDVSVNATERVKFQRNISRMP